MTSQSNHKKLGGEHDHMDKAFRDVLNECGFMDLSFVGPMFTWHKHFENYSLGAFGPTVATNDWFSIFSDAKVYHLDMMASDHKALLIRPEGMECS